MLLHQWAQALVSVYNFAIQRKAVFTMPWDSHTEKCWIQMRALVLYQSCAGESTAACIRSLWGWEAKFPVWWKMLNSFWQKFLVLYIKEWGGSLRQLTYTKSLLQWVRLYYREMLIVLLLGCSCKPGLDETCLKAWKHMFILVCICCLRQWKELNSLKKSFLRRHRFLVSSDYMASTEGGVRKYPTALCFLE